MNRLLRQSDRDRGPGRQPYQQVFGRVVHIRRINAAMDQTPRRRVGSAHLLAEEQHLFRARRTHKPRQQPSGSRISTEAAGQERLPEHGIGGCEGEVGGEREVAAEADRPPPDSAQDR
jgi:hypothetical protein